MKDHPTLFRYLIAVGVCYVIAMAIYFSRVSDVLTELDTVQSSCPEPDRSQLSIETPLAHNKHIDALSYATVKARAEDIRHRYNRNANLCRVVRQHLMKLIKDGYIGEGVVSHVQNTLSTVERQNALLKRQYDVIVAFAEKQYVKNLSREHEIRTEEDAHLLDSQNERLLKAVETPLEL